jgi:molybdopterin-binding protein
MAVSVGSSIDLSLAEHVCLAVIAESESHGWAIGSLLASEGEIGRVWSLTRPLTYRAIDGLVVAKLVQAKKGVTDSSRERVIFRATPAGRKVVDRWLAQPVEHLRDVRTELLLKLVFAQRQQLPISKLLADQRSQLRDVMETLLEGGPEFDVVDVWRREHARAVNRFLDQAERLTSGKAQPQTVATQGGLRLSARNQVRATVQSVTYGEVMASVKVSVNATGQPQVLTAAITRDAVNDLDIAAGDDVVLIMKATEVLIAKS